MVVQGIGCSGIDASFDIIFTQVSDGRNLHVHKDIEFDGMQEVISHIGCISSSFFVFHYAF